MAERDKKVLMLDSGSRAQATAKHFRDNSPEVGEIFIAPGNAGTEFIEAAQNLAVDINNFAQVVEAIRDHHIDYVVIAPEEPLVNGIVDFLEEEGIEAFGPTRKAARLEGSKAWTMRFLEKIGVPIPRYEIVNKPGDAHRFIDNLPVWASQGIAVKPDGIEAGGKGVVVTDNIDEAHEAVRNIMERKIFGEAGRQIVFQEKLSGYEVSWMTMVLGRHFNNYPPTEDHKQVWDNDKGPNTGGMGACAPHPLVTKKDMDIIDMMIIRLMVREMANRGIDFNGVLYPALFMTKDGPKVIEVNVRIGGSEWEALTRLLDFDLFRAMRGDSWKFNFREGCAISVALCSAGYPGTYEKGKEICGLEKSYDGVEVYHAGTAKNGEKFVTSGGRVVFVTGYGADVDEAREKAYGAIGENGVRFEGMHYRKDIGKRKRNGSD